MNRFGAGNKQYITKDNTPLKSYEEMEVNHTGELC